VPTLIDKSEAYGKLETESTSVLIIRKQESLEDLDPPSHPDGCQTDIKEEEEVYLVQRGRKMKFVPEKFTFLGR